MIPELTGAYLFDAHYLRNMPLRHIARVTGRSRDEVEAALADVKLKIRQDVEDAAEREDYPALLTPELLVEEHHTQGRDVAVIAKRYGVRYDDVIACFDAHDVEVLDYGDPPPDRSGHRGTLS